MTAADVRDWCATFYADANHDHMVFPGMVYISHPSEYGTLYTKAELEELHAVCQEYQMPLFMDGARLGYGLMAEGTDVTLQDIARLTDVFYIGGTKVGALCGEAVVFPHGAPAHFMTMVKQQGALLAKGRLLGLQFDVLFTDDLYTKISKNAIETANPLKKGLAAKGYRFFMDSPTNQVFAILENSPAGSAGRPGEVRLLGEVRRHPHRDAHRHQLGHPHGRDRAADCPDVTAKARRSFMQDCSCISFTMWYLLGIPYGFGRGRPADGGRAPEIIRRKDYYHGLF